MPLVAEKNNREKSLNLQTNLQVHIIKHTHTHKITVKAIIRKNFRAPQKFQKSRGK